MTKYIPFIVAFALFMETLDSTIINTAIPEIALDLGTDPISLKIALTSYLLSLAIFIPISGWVAEKFGNKRVFISAFGIFTLGSLCCGLAVNLELLVLSRIVQGIGGALMMPVGRLILIKAFPRKDLVKVMNYVTIPSLIGPALGPVLGGLIISYISWRWIFFVNIPIGITAMMISLKMLPNSKSNDSLHKLDFLGFIIFGIGLAGLTMTLQSLGDSLLNYIELLILGGLSLLFLCVYFIRASRIAYPIIDKEIFRIRTFRLTIIGSFISRCGIGGIPFLLPLFFQLSFGMTPLVSALLLLPYASAMIVMKFFVKSSLKQFGFKTLLISNTLLVGLSIFSLALITEQTSGYIIALLLIIHGLFASLQFSCMNVLTYADLSEVDISKGTSIGSATHQLSMSFGIAIAAMVLTFLSAGSSDAFHMETSTFQITFLVLGTMTTLSTIIFMFLKKTDGAQASEHNIRIVSTNANSLINEVK